ncbi:hypothetical protein BACPLE_02972 [Phocaeicola plebeius DSM 17135]|uniref:Uncharacterized protein n=1 Tax=Phocaeicola plebeius (strain DSM 17135 / JCM 12973 / CCUG 54634 / M2) TaxID=484018 RepID=B5D1X1_PHOPM|nr:hypothetical protein BACPLE_02972 [Phocaeicola plebeius DSM 17135]
MLFVGYKYLKEKKKLVFSFLRGIKKGYSRKNILFTISFSVDYASAQGITET